MIENPTQNSNEFGGLSIVRLAPKNQRVIVEYRLNSAGEIPQSAKLKAYYYELEKSDTVYEFECDFSASKAEITGLNNEVDYCITLKVIDSDSNELACSANRLFRCGFVPGTIIAYLHPEDYTFNSSGRSTASPSIIRLSENTLVASHDIYWSNGNQNISHIFRSEDNGDTWHFASSLTPCFWGSLFVHQGLLHMICTSTEYGAVLVFRSSDGGYTWSEPTQLLEAGSRETGGPHKAPMGVIRYKGRLWTAIEWGSWDTRKHIPGAISADETADLLDASAWQCTGFLKYNPEWKGVVKGPSQGTIEGNVVVGKDGKLYNLLRYDTKNCEPNYGKVLVIEIDADNPSKLPEFSKVIDFPGNLSKFFIAYDERTGNYYALANRVTLEGEFSQRNILSLLVSDDLVHWTLQRDILNYADNCWHEGVKEVGFQYPSFIYDGKDILAVSRTAINGADNFHNANYITFHRIKNYDALYYNI